MGVQWRTCSAARTDYLDSWHSLRRHVRVWLSLWLRIAHENPVGLAISVCIWVCLIYPFSVYDSTWSLSIFPFSSFPSSLYTLFFCQTVSTTCKHSLCNFCPSVKKETGFLAVHPNSNPVALASSERERERKGGRKVDRHRKRERDCLGCWSLTKYFQLQFSSRKFQLNLIISSSRSLWTLCPAALQLPTSP